VEGCGCCRAHRTAPFRQGLTGGRGLANEPTSRGDYRRVSGSEVVCITPCRFVTSYIRMGYESSQLARIRT
jgi:hypothetical protein